MVTRKLSEKYYLTDIDKNQTHLSILTTNSQSHSNCFEFGKEQGGGEGGGEQGGGGGEAETVNVVSQKVGWSAPNSP